MTGDDGDDDDVPVGPPPDPSVRPWRHPSEIAAANAAAAAAASMPTTTLVTPSSRRHVPRRQPLVFVGGVALGLLGVLAVRSALSTERDFASQTAAIGQPTAEVASLVSSGEDPGDPTATSTTIALLSTTAAPAPTIAAPGGTALTDHPQGHLAATVFTADGTTPLASGVIVDGMVITSAAAIGSAVDLVVVTVDGPQPAVVQGVDDFTDLAVIVVTEGGRLPSPPVTTVSLGWTGSELGSPVALLESAGALDGSIVENLGQLTGVNETVTTASGRLLHDAFMTSARTSRWSAGAPLVDAEGRLIGMAVACDGQLVDALPIEPLRRVARSIVDSGWPSAAWLGIEGAATDAGVALAAVEVGGPAAAAGLVVGDVIVAVDGAAISSIDDVIRVTRAAGPGARLTVTVERSGEALSLTIEVGTRPVSAGSAG